MGRRLIALSMGTLINTVPFYYTYVTRIRSIRGAMSYVWMEAIPLVLAIATFNIAASAWFVLFHWSFIGLYEIGYIFNDSARTAVEATSVNRKAVISANRSELLRVVVVKIAIFIFICVINWWEFGWRPAACYCVGGLCVLVVLLAHTRVGGTIRAGDPARWVLFGWLACFKYAPALLACVAGSEAILLCLAFFSIYGVGRVIEYAIRKHRGAMPPSMLSINTAWFIVAAPIGVIFASYSTNEVSLYALYAGVASHHVKSSLFRLLCKGGTESRAVAERI